MTENRVPKGTPAGGQFAPSAHAEAAVSLTSTVPGEDGETLVRAFSCETHDAVGECTQECVDLLWNMDGPGPEPVYDPYRVHGGPDRPYDTYEYDAEQRAAVRVTHVPEGQALVSTLQPGQWVYVDHQPRQVDSVSAARHGRVFVDFAGPDREPDGTPTAYFSRRFSLDQALPLAEPDA